MLGNLTLRKKILLSYTLLLILFIGLMIPFANQLVKSIIIRSMENQASELIKRIQDAPTHEALIRYLKGQKPTIFFRVGIITDEMKVLYDSHTKRVLGPDFSQDFTVFHPEVIEALETGSGYHEEYSAILEQKFAYFAKAFNFHGKTYVIRIAFPFQYVEQLFNDFERGFLLMATFGLLSFSLLTWYVIHRLTRPIEEIIRVISPYQEGLRSTVPEIILPKSNPNDEFGRLASTLNSLSAKIQRQIENLVEERNEKEAILESLSEGVVAVDSDMSVTYSNQAALRFLGFEADHLLGRDFMVTGQKECDNMLNQCQEEESETNSSIRIKLEGSVRYIDLTSVPIKGKRGAVLVFKDRTTEHKVMEMRKDFVANASHELKTPIQIILGFAETLHESEDLPKDKMTEMTKKIIRNSQRMNNIIKDLLILSDVENIPLSRLEECDLYEICTNAKQTLLSLYPDAEVLIDLKVDKEPLLIGDPYLLELAINNLVGNAAKYSKQPAKITIAIEKDGDFYSLSVGDEGIGIPEQDLEHLFERFYTVDKARSRRLGGSGLGLSIVSTIVEKHFGEIHVESTVDVGSTFTILLPIKRPE